MKSPKAPEKSKEQKDLEQAQTDELASLKTKDEAQKKALTRKRRGRSSLLSGDERGITKETLG